jgi:hypothetical protein
MLTNRAATLAKAVLLIFGLGLMSMLLQIAMSY